MSKQITIVYKTACGAPISEAISETTITEHGIKFACDTMTPGDNCYTLHGILSESEDTLTSKLQEEKKHINDLFATAAIFAAPPIAMGNHFALEGFKIPDCKLTIKSSATEIVATFLFNTDVRSPHLLC